MLYVHCLVFFFFNDTATTEIYTLSLHDALPISDSPANGSTAMGIWMAPPPMISMVSCAWAGPARSRSEEHTSELQSQSNLVCRLLLEKKKNTTRNDMTDLTESSRPARNNQHTLC